MIVKLSPNGWHRRLQLWTFGNDFQQFQNFCPYFWTTIGCVFMTPIVACGKGAVFGLKLFFERLGRVIDAVNLARLRRNVRLMSDLEVYEILWALDHAGSYSYESLDFFAKALEILKSFTPNWQEKVASVRASEAAKFLVILKKREEEAAQEFLKRQARNKLRARIFQTIGKIVPVVGVILAGTFGVTVIVTAFITDFVVASLAVAVLLALSAVVVGCLAALGKILKLAQAGMFDRPAKIIKTPFAFFWAFVKTVKANHCPAIDWTAE